MAQEEPTRTPPSGRVVPAEPARSQGGLAAGLFTGNEAGNVPGGEPPGRATEHAVGSQRVDAGSGVLPQENPPGGVAPRWLQAHPGVAKEAVPPPEAAAVPLSAQEPGPDARALPAGECAQAALELQEHCRLVVGRLGRIARELEAARRDTPLRAVPDTCFRLGPGLEILDYKVVPGALPVLSGDLVGKSAASVLPGQLVASVRAAMADAPGGPVRTESVIRIKGREHHFESRVMPLDQGEAILVVRDMTELKRAEREAVKARELAEEASQAKSEFLAHMSHEIRTPLSGIVGLTDLALSQVTGEKERGYLMGVKESLRSLLAIINDILDFSKIEARRLSLKEEPFDLRATLASVLEPFKAQAAAKGVGLSMAIEPGTPCALVGDELRLKQVVSNLVSNAVKFTERGVVTVLAEPGDEAEAGRGEALLRFSVSDTGVGIDPAKHRAIFEKFVQGGVSTAKEFDGTGLGLPICRSIVEMMGGSIWVESEPGKGSTFSFTMLARRQESPGAHGESPSLGNSPFPREEPPDHAARPVREEPPGRGQGALDILLAEDNDINRMLAVEFLKAMGHTVTAVRDGVETVEALTRGRFDVVLLDISMPRLDGYEVIGKLRAGEVEGADPAMPVVALTAFAMDEDRKRILESGADAYLPKPLDTAELANVLNVVGMRKRKDAQPSGGGPPSPDPAGRA